MSHHDSIYSKPVKTHEGILNRIFEGVRREICGRSMTRGIAPCREGGIGHIRRFLSLCIQSVINVCTLFPKSKRMLKIDTQLSTMLSRYL